MSSLVTRLPKAESGSRSEELVQSRWRRRMIRSECYAVALLLGLQLSVVYVIGTLVLSCVGS